jgi:aminoglycoside phosphotransferase (APT) family kinase protein
MITQLGSPLYNTGRHFEWGHNHVIKLFNSETPREWIDTLRDRQKKLYTIGLPVPQVGEIVEVDGKLGLVSERIFGNSLGDTILSITDHNPEQIKDYARQFAATHADIHAIHEFDIKLPSQRELFSQVIHRIGESIPKWTDVLINLLESMPTGGAICHGDYHPFNALKDSKGLTIIDWNNMHSGDPIEDVARTKLILTGFSQQHPDFSPIVDPFLETYLEHYFSLSELNQSDIEPWWPIVAAIRLADNIPEIEPWLPNEIRVYLA